jgi:hypothetical protein
MHLGKSRLVSITFNIRSMTVEVIHRDTNDVSPPALWDAVAGEELDVLARFHLASDPAKVAEQLTRHYWTKPVKTITEVLQPRNWMQEFKRGAEEDIWPEMSEIVQEWQTGGRRNARRVTRKVLAVGKDVQHLLSHST